MTALALAAAELRRVTRDRTFLFFLVVLPVLVILLVIMIVRDILVRRWGAAPPSPSDVTERSR